MITARALLFIPPLSISWPQFKPRKKLAARDQSPAAPVRNLRYHLSGPMATAQAREKQILSSARMLHSRIADAATPCD
jgi:hypothetical protein